MVTITFPDRATLRKGLGYLMLHSAGHILKTGEVIVPNEAMVTLAEQRIPFTVKGTTTYEEQVAALRGSASNPVQRRKRRSA